MRKKHIVSKVSSNLGFDNTDIGYVFDEIIKIMAENLSDGDDIYIRGLGSFIIREKKAMKKIIRGKEVLIPSKKKIDFRPSTNIKNSLENK